LDWMQDLKVDILSAFREETLKKDDS